MSAPSPRHFGVVGSPIGHSLSPALHRAAYRALGLGDLTYTAHEVSAGSLAGFLEGGEGAELEGVSVTMPLKREAFELGARDGGRRDPVAERLGIANTLVRQPGGTWRAENFDVHGILASLADHGLERAQRAAVIGSGATALSALAALLDLGARDVRLTARTPTKLAPMIALAERSGVQARVIPWEQAEQVLGADAVVSALALEGGLDLAERFEHAAAQGTEIPTPGVFLDVLYHPWPAPLAAFFAARGAEVASGLEMLIHQAADQVASMLGIDRAEVPLAAMRAAAEDELSRR